MLTLFSGNSELWKSNSSNGVGSYKLVMQNDGNLVIYDSSKTPRWASNTVRY